MKKIYSYLVLIIALLGAVSCSQKQDKTIANLKTAIDGEATASAKYAAFAEKAAKEKLHAVEALFKTTSQAEAIHAKNHQAVLASLGMKDYKPNVGKFDVKSTPENLQAAIDGETYEFTTMYPGFIEDANAEGVQDALISFTYAQDTEKGHGKLYTDALSQINTPEMLAMTYYVCPKCGNTYAGTPSEVCEFCQTPSSQFIAVETIAPATPQNATTGTSSQMVQ